MHGDEGVFSGASEPTVRCSGWKKQQTSAACVSEINGASGLTRLWGDRVFRKDTGKLEGEQWQGERAGRHRV